MIKFQATPPALTAFFSELVRRHHKHLLRTLLAGALSLAGPLRAANIATEGTGILGVNDAIDSDAGTPRYNAGTAANINDGVPTDPSRVDTWSGNLYNDQPVSFVGIIWPTTRYDQISSLTLTLATFTDGGWFGTPGIGPGAGGTLTSMYLIEPTIQVTTDGGVTWSDVGSTSDYLTVMDGHGIGGGANPNPTSQTATFTLNTTTTEINGIRIIGMNGGFAGSDTNGFLGVFELAVEAAPFVDSDSDGMPDDWETAHGLIVGINDAGIDSEPDGLSNLQEFQYGTDPSLADTDGDGLNDGDEITTYLTNPVLADTDGDGLSDGDEANIYFTDPLVADTDGDGLSDGDEVMVYLTDPRDNDTDFDGFTDGMEVAQGSDPNNPSNFPDNVALIGTGIMGTKPDLLSATDTVYSQQGTPQFINDGDPNTRVDTYNGGQPNSADTVSYVGVTWTEPLIYPVVTLELTLATFIDGGWFGPNNSGPGAGGALTPSYLVEPEIQTTVDGVTWVPVAHTSDYLTALDGHKIGGGTVPNPSSVTAMFTLTDPASGIMGIRIAGTEGGTASAGFLGVFELAVRTPVTDSDNDGMSDSWERLHGLDVGIDDSAEDPDGDGLTNLGEFNADTDPQVADTDGDTLSDGDEVNVYHTNPTRADTDGDGLNDDVELNVYQTDPLLRDTDGDQFNDGLEVSLGTSPTNAADYPSNFALIGTGIMGTRDTVDAGVETPYSQAGTPANINDGNLTTRVDTWNNTATSTASYVGILWDEPVASPIVQLQLSLAIFFDGGWFGVNNIGPGSGGFLSAATDLVEPTVQVSTNRGTNWTTIGNLSDYMIALDGQPLPAVDFGPPTLGTATFMLDEPQTNITGIRIIGTEGGTASGGFLGVFELEADALVIPAVTIVNVGIDGGQFRFEFDTQTGYNYVVEYKDTVDAVSWTTLTTITGDDSRQQVTDSLGNAQRIYRVTTE